MEPASLSNSVYALTWNSRRLVSLWDIMNHFDVYSLASILHKLSTEEAGLFVCKVGGSGGVTPTIYISGEVSSTVVLAEALFQHSDLKGCRDATAKAKDQLAKPFTDVSTMMTIIHRLQVDIISEFEKRYFLKIADDRAIFLDQPKLFGDEVDLAFPSAKGEIKEAGNCLAAELSTAAVFHLMRVSEYGLRALARDRRIKVPNKPIELATWDDIIKKLEDAEKAIQGYPKTLARESQFEFYHGAMMEFKRFKNVFRNRVMHTRKDFDRDEAHSVYGHVKEFMVILAGKISETKKTPLIWKK